MTAERLLAHVDDAFVASLATRLISVPGHEDLPQHERDVAVTLREALAGEGVPARLVEVGDDRFNVVAGLRGGRKGPRLLLTGHLDTVPPYGMVDACRARVERGRLRGRGAVDMRGALACMAGALVAWLRAGGPDAGELAFAAVAGEESGSVGMQQLVRSTPRADLAIVGEPTRLEVVLAHKGAMWVGVEFRGRAAHASVPERGINAIEHAARFVAALGERLRPRLRGREHYLVGNPTVSVGVVRGGDRPPMVPASCTVELDRRWIPGEAHAEVLEELRDLLRELAGEVPDLSWRLVELEGTAGVVHAPLDCPRNAPGLDALEAALAQVTGRRASRVGANYWTDAALLSDSGVPAVVCGPGDIAQAHSDDEYVELDQLEAATRVYLLTAARFLGGRPAG